jgi:hypothetical protein
MKTLDYGTNPHYLVRQDDPDTSHAAAQSVDTTALEQMVHKAITDFGSHGCISDQVLAKFPGYPYSSITARYKALLDKGFIIDTGVRRPGYSGRNQRVMVSKHWVKN